MPMAPHASTSGDKHVPRSRQNHRQARCRRDSQGHPDDARVDVSRGAGCLSYELYQQTDAPHIFQSVEAWKQKADADAHMATPHLGAAVAAATPLFAAPPEILGYSKLA
ncbi:MAG TPA: putative quinol monooxygenase [Variovorax sp.]